MVSVSLNPNAAQLMSLIYPEHVWIVYSSGIVLFACLAHDNSLLFVWWCLNEFADRISFDKALKWMRVLHNTGVTILVEWNVLCIVQWWVFLHSWTGNWIKDHSSSHLGSPFFLFYLTKTIKRRSFEQCFIFLVVNTVLLPSKPMHLACIRKVLAILSSVIFDLPWLVRQSSLKTSNSQ
jgi:hypothetical protein